MLSNIRCRTAVFACALLAGAFIGGCSKFKQQNHLEALQVAPGVTQLAKGTRGTLSVTALYHDQTSRDVTAEASWTSMDASIATVSAGGQVRAVAVGSTTILAIYSGIGSTTTVTVTSARLTSVQVTPPVSSVAKGLAVKLAATGTFTDATTQDLTSQATWTSTSPAVVSIQGGVATAQGVGTALVSASVGDAASSAAVTVTDAQVASIAIFPASPTLPLNTSLQLKATGHLTDNTEPVITDQVVWATDDPDVASVVGGMLHAEGVGTAHVTASLPLGRCTADFGCATTMKVTVTDAMLTRIVLSPANLSMPVGLSRQYHALGTFTDGTSHDVTDTVTWRSSAPEVAFVEAGLPRAGLATTRSVGTAVISASGAGWAEGASATLTASTALTVTDAVLMAITVEDGCAAGCGPLALGLTRQLRAYGLYGGDATHYDLTEQVTWESSDTGKAIVSNAPGSQGLVTSVGAGSARLTATCPRTLVSGFKELLVSEKLLVALRIDPASATVPRGIEQRFKAIGRFTDNSEENLTTSAAWDAGVKIPIDVKDDSKVAVANTSTSDVGVVTVTAVMPDVCPFCSFAGMKATARLEVTAAVLTGLAISAPDKDIPARLHYQLTASGSFSDNTTLDVTELATWGSLDESFATVSSGPEPGRGVVHGWRPTSEAGVVITAAYGGLTAERSLVVNDFELLEIVVVPVQRTQAPFHEPTHVNYRLPLGLATEFIALGRYGPQPPSVELAPLKSTQTVLRVYDVTRMAVWESHPFLTSPIVEPQPPVALVALDGDHADVSAVGLGHTTLSAEDPHTGRRGEVVFETIDAIPTGLVVTPSTATIALGTSQQFTATVTLSNGDEVVQTAEADWSTGDSPFAKPVDGQPGRILGKAVTPPGQPVVVTATLGGLSGVAKLTVSNEELLSITVTPADRSIPLGTSLQMTAMGLFTTGERDITGDVRWDSSAHDAAPVSNAVDSRGLAIALKLGTVTVTAVLADPFDGGLVSGSTTLTVIPPAPMAILVSPAEACIAVGDTVSYGATAYYTDASHLDVTAAVDWSSDAPAIASMEGNVATGLAAGHANIVATDAASGGSGSASLDVCQCACTACVECTCN